MRTREVADQVGVNAQTLRYYERRGLLAEPPRSSSGYRDYPDAAVRLLRFIKRAQELGFALDQVEQLIHLADGGPPDCDAAAELAGEHLTELDRRIADLHRMRDAVAELVSTCRLDRADRRCALLDAINGEPA